MPNWCNNVLQLTHNDSEMIKRASSAFSQGRLFDEFIPVPSLLKETSEENNLNHSNMLLEKTGYHSWYEFCTTEWGTKWDVGGEDCPVEELSQKVISLVFDSAWSPPIEAYQKLTDLCGFTIEAQYYESGMAFCGTWTSDGDDIYYNIRLFIC